MNRIPILKMGPYLLVSIQSEMEDSLATVLEDDLMSEIVRTGAGGVLIDISGLGLVDSFTGRMLATIVASARLLGVEAVVTGMRPAVAMTLVELGVSLPGVRTALTIERGMEDLKKAVEGDGRAAD